MKNTYVTFFTVLITLITVSSCKNVERTASSNGLEVQVISVPVRGSTIAHPPTIIYKTRSDYAKHIPVNLSTDHTYIISYPGVKDIYYNGELSYPTVLAYGYLLDNRGISPQVAFLDFTYEQYRNLAETPTADELFKHIIDADPLTELFSCPGERDTTHLNILIKANGLMHCANLKE
jgi:hypothetical protein